MRSVPGDALDNDPFFREFHRRHPDVDVVVLAGQEPTATEPVDAATARRVAADTRATFDDIWPSIGDGPADPEVTWRTGTVTGVVHTELTASVAADRVRGTQLLHQSADALSARGWAVQEHGDGVPRVVASHADTSVRVAWWDDTLTVVLQGPGTSVGADALRELMAQDPS